MNELGSGGGGHAVGKPLSPSLLLAHFCHNYNYLSNQRIALTPPPPEFVLKPSLRQVHGKAREAQGTGTRSLLGAEGTSGSVSGLLANVSPCLLDFPRWRARGLSERRAKPGAGEEARRAAWCQGAGCSAVSSALGAGPALGAPGRSPLARLSPPQAGGVRGGRPAHSVPVRSRRRGTPGTRAELSRRSRAERRSCPNSRSRSARPLGSCCSGARCRGWRGAAARRARTWAPAPARDPSGAGRGGAGPGAGPRYLSASPRGRRPAHLVPAPRKSPPETCPRKRKA